MSKLWSISTTIRNPIRLKSILSVLSSLENEPFDNERQIKFQILLIQNRLYKPKSMTDSENEIFEDPEQIFTFEMAAEIFHRQEYEDPAMRGRQSVNPLNKLGLASARARGGPIHITNLGQALIQGEQSVESVFLAALSKLQFPNPNEKTFTRAKGFDVRPLIATLKFLKQVRVVYGSGGLTSTEFSLFIPSLINHSLINEWVNKVGEYRRSNNKEEFIHQFATEFYGHTPTEKEISNFHEYGDNIMRYFRMTRLFRVTRREFGAEWRIDYETLREAEIENILASQTPKARDFETAEEYITYLNLIEEIGADRSVALEVRNHIESHKANTPPEYEHSVSEFLAKPIDRITDLPAYIENGRDLLRILLEKEQSQILRHNIDQLQEIIDQLSEPRQLKKIEPEELEYLITQSLRIIDDEEQIIPHYLTDDRGLPIGHAPGNNPDIEAFYTSFNSIIEVTKSNSSHQWIMETAPVMRHLQEFEIRNSDKPAYCIFIAPGIHTDTGHHFFFSNTQGFNGNRQRIVPLTINQYVQILRAYHRILGNRATPTHESFKSLLDSVLTSAARGHDEWLQTIEIFINSWISRLSI
jgi:hypothetical protein